jgi:hypothetical protein
LHISFRRIIQKLALINPDSHPKQDFSNSFHTSSSISISTLLDHIQKFQQLGQQREKEGVVRVRSQLVAGSNPALGDFMEYAHGIPNRTTTI